MKSSELMIGDWVLSKSDDKNYKVDSIIKQSDGSCLLATKDDLSFDYMFEPIPITIEILLKNGFKRIEGDRFFPAARYWWAEKGKRDGYLVEITPYNPPVNGVKFLTSIHTESMHESGVNKVHNCDIEYVHQLQHAMKLCGIEKEIEL